MQMETITYLNFCMHLVWFDSVKGIIKLQTFLKVKSFVFKIKGLGYTYDQHLKDGRYFIKRNIKQVPNF